jgi:hypothetical protein
MEMIGRLNGYCDRDGAVKRLSDGFAPFAFHPPDRVRPRSVALRPVARSTLLGSLPRRTRAGLPPSDLISSLDLQNKILFRKTSCKR